MNSTCIVVADAKYARFFSVEPGTGPGDRTKLVQRSMLFNPDVEAVRRGGAERVKTERVSNRQAGDVHPIEARRQQHRLELERRFGREIARQTSEIASSWRSGTVVLIADPRLLGLMREAVRDALKPAIELKELAKDYVGLSPDELHDHLARSNIVPARRPTAA
jgi:protein required for attachment to host cells